MTETDGSAQGSKDAASLLGHRAPQCLMACRRVYLGHVHIDDWRVAIQDNVLLLVAERAAVCKVCADVAIGIGAVARKSNLGTHIIRGLEIACMIWPYLVDAETLEPVP